MADNTSSTMLEKAISGNLPIGELIDAASHLSARDENALARQLYKVWINFNREHPQLYVVYFNCSALDSQAGDLDAAIDSLNKAIAINPDFLPAYINLGGILERSGAADRAVELWRSAVRRPLLLTGATASYVSTTLKQIARVLSDHQHIENAEAIVQHCLDINPQQTDLIEQYVALRLAQCKWPTIVPGERLDRKSLVKGVHPLSMSVYTDDPLLQL